MTIFDIFDVFSVFDHFCHFWTLKGWHFYDLIFYRFSLIFDCKTCNRRPSKGVSPAMCTIWFFETSKMSQIVKMSKSTIGQKSKMSLFAKNGVRETKNHTFAVVHVFVFWQKSYWKLGLVKKCATFVTTLSTFVSHKIVKNDIFAIFATYVSIFYDPTIWSNFTHVFRLFSNEKTQRTGLFRHATHFKNRSKTGKMCQKS
mgnify:CR=1 FL=1